MRALAFFTGMGLLATAAPWGIAVPLVLVVFAATLTALLGLRGTLAAILGFPAFLLAADWCVPHGYALGERLGLPFLGTWAAMTLAQGISYPSLFTLLVRKPDRNS